MEIRDTRDMALTMENFQRTLPRAIGDHSYTLHARGATVSVGDGEVLIELGPQQVRKIALLEIPWCRVEFVAKNLSDDQFKEFAENFHRHFQRGGG